MVIPEDFNQLIERLHLELEEINQNVTKGINLIRPVLSQFPENILLVQFFAYLNNVFFLVENYRDRIQNAIYLLSLPNITAIESQEAVQELSTMLGVVLETKMRVSTIVDRLKNLS
jgi:hypothetical protein